MPFLTQNLLGFKEFVALMALLISLTALSIDAILPALSIIGRDLSIANINHTQYMISFLFIGFSLGQILCGPIADSFGRKVSAYIGLSIFIFGSFLSCIADSFFLMLLGRFLQGIGAASPRTTSNAMIRDIYKGTDMARVMSFVMAVFIFVPVIAPALGEAILYLSHWRVIFMVFLAFALFVMAWISFRLPETQHPEDRVPFRLSAIKTTASKVLSNRITVGYTLCSGVIFGALIGYLNSSRQIFQDYYHTGEHFALYFALSALSIGVASLLNSAIVKRFGMRIISRNALRIMIIASAAFLSFLFFYDSQVPLTLFMIYTLVVFFCFGLLFGNFTAMAMEPMGHFAGMASGIIGALSSLISVSIGTLIGQSYNETLYPLTVGFLCVALIAFCIQFLLQNPKQPKESLKS